MYVVGMKRQDAFDLYTDFLLRSTKLVSGTGLSTALNGSLQQIIEVIF